MENKKHEPENTITPKKKLDVLSTFSLPYYVSQVGVHARATYERFLQHQELARALAEAYSQRKAEVDTAIQAIERLEWIADKTAAEFWAEKDRQTKQLEAFDKFAREQSQFIKELEDEKEKLIKSLHDIRGSY